MALQNGEISWDQWFTITQTEDYRKASKLLGRYKEKAEKAKQEHEIELLRQQDANAERENQRKLQQIDRKGMWDLKIKQQETKSFVAAAQLQANNKINLKEIQEASATSKQQAKTEGTIKVEREKQNLKQQEPLSPG